MYGYIQAVIIFFLFLGPLIFFHELGHFVCARLFKVRVEVFSLGFGPKILKFKKGFTEYAISLIPLGGYVKMFGDDPLTKNEISEEDKKFSFIHQGKMARFWIVFGGPLANFILAYFIFACLMLVGERLPEIRFGNITDNSTFYSYGIRSGDVLKKINGAEVLSPSDMMLEGKDQITSITVERMMETRQFGVDISAKDFFEGFGKYSPTLRKPILTDKNGRKFALSLDSSKVNWKISLESMAQNFQRFDFTIFPIKDFSNTESKIVFDDNTKRLSLEWSGTEDFFASLAKKGYRTVDLGIKNVTMGSPADKAGLVSGDVFISLNGKPLYSFEHLRDGLQEKDIPKTSKIEVWRKGKIVQVGITPEARKIDGKEVRMIGVESSILHLGVNFIFTKPKGVISALSKAFDKTIGSITTIAVGFKKLITKEVPLKSVGGPIAIAQAATDSFNTSLSYFFQIMALISVNLGIINLFPIPILDGGHLMFIAIEVVNRGPISRRKLEIAQQFGLSILLLLMVVALFNDFSRIF